MNILSVELRPLLHGEPWSYGNTITCVWNELQSQGHSVIRTSAEGFFGKHADDKLNTADVVIYQGADLIKPQYYLPEKSVIRLGSMTNFNITAIKQCKSVVVTNKALLLSVKAIHSDVCLIQNGIDIDKWAVLPEREEFTVGFSAHQLQQGKGFDLVQSACEKAGVKLKTALYPDTYIPYSKMYEEFYGNISCLVSASSSEGCSNTVMEALSCGIPVILTKVGYHGDTLTDGRNCLFTQRDSNHIAECITRLKNDAVLRNTLRMEGRKFAEVNHNHKEIAKMYLACLERSAGNTIKKAAPKKEIPQMPKLLFVADQRGWAYDNRCNELKKHLPEYDIDITYFHEMPAIDHDKYDLIYFAGYILIGEGRNIPRLKVVTSLAGMVTYTAEEAARYINQSFACSVFNRDHFRAIYEHTDSALFYIPNGVDTELFKPAELPKDLVIGWAGHSKHKGKRLDWLQVACKNMNVPLVIQDRDVNYIPHDKMPEFYHQLSCYACVSESEGSNNSILEAAACGVPIITTPCGNYQSIVQNDGGYILRSDLSDLEDKINLMKHAIRENMSHKLRIRILNGWTWKQRAKQYKEMFDYVLQNQIDGCKIRVIGEKL